MDDLISDLRQIGFAWEQEEDTTLALLDSIGDEIKTGKGAKIKGELVDLLPIDKQEAHFDEAISQCLLQHLYREGNFEVGDTLAAELHSMTEAKWKEPFEEMHNLIQSLAAHDIRPAIDWIEKNDLKLGPIADNLRFKLHSLAYIDLLKANKVQEALKYVRKNVFSFAPKFAKDMDTLMGALAFANSLKTSPYIALLREDIWDEAEDSLVSSYCAALGLPRESALRLCINIGTLAWPRISRVLSIMKHQPGVEWDPQEELPVEIEPGSESRFHSVFVCPVLRQQSTESNPPMMMPCGHVISQEALMRLCKGNAHYRIKCPYCPAESTASNALRIHF